MLKKAKVESASARDKNLSKAILDSSRQIWLAGLGAFSKAQQEGMKMFETLVKQGESVEAKTRAAAKHTAEAARGAAKAKAKDMQAMAGETWDKLEQVFEDRVARALGRLGVYTSSDIQKLTDRVNALSESVNALLKAQGVKPKRRAAPPEETAKSARGSATPTSAESVSAASDTAGQTISTTGKPAKKTPKTGSKTSKTATK